MSPSEFLANIIRQKLPNNRIDVIVNGIDEHVDATGCRDDGYFLYLGRLSQEKVWRHSPLLINGRRNECH